MYVLCPHTCCTQGQLPSLVTPLGLTLVLFWTGRVTCPSGTDACVFLTSLCGCCLLGFTRCGRLVTTWRWMFGSNIVSAMILTLTAVLHVALTRLWHLINLSMMVTAAHPHRTTHSRWGCPHSCWLLCLFFSCYDSRCRCYFVKVCYLSNFTKLFFLNSCWQTNRQNLLTYQHVAGGSYLIICRRFIKHFQCFYSSLKSFLFGQSKQVAIVWACVVKSRQWLNEEMYGVWSVGCQSKM